SLRRGSRRLRRALLRRALLCCFSLRCFCHLCTCGLYRVCDGMKDINGPPFSSDALSAASFGCSIRPHLNALRHHIRIAVCTPNAASAYTQDNVNGELTIIVPK